jgi:hypothetical protein
MAAAGRAAAGRKTRHAAGVHVARRVIILHTESVATIVVARIHRLAVVWNPNIFLKKIEETHTMLQGPN